MIKDYIPFTKETVAKFWSSHWKKNQFKINYLCKTEEYFLLKKYLKNKKIKILDVGCGLGHWVHFLSNQGFLIDGCELSRQLVSRLNENSNRKIFFQADIRRPKNNYLKYNLIFSWGAFEHFENGPGQCLEGASQMLKRNGKLVFTVPYQNLRLSLQKIFSNKRRKLIKTKFYQYRFTSQEISQELKNVGLRPVEIKPIHALEGLKRFLHHCFGVKYDSFFNKIIAWLLKPFVGMFFYHMIFIACEKER